MRGAQKRTGTTFDIQTQSTSHSADRIPPGVTGREGGSVAITLVFSRRRISPRVPRGEAFGIYAPVRVAHTDRAINGNVVHNA